MRPSNYFFLLLGTGMLAMLVIAFSILASAHIPDAGTIAALDEMYNIPSTPLDCLQLGPEHGTIALSGIDPQSVKAIDDLNTNLSAWDDKGMVDLGHYYSENRVIKQNDTPTAIYLKNWSDGWIFLPESFVRS